MVQSAIDDFLDDRAVELESIAKDLRPLVDYSRDLLRGGKRFRALFCYWGWQAVRARPSDLDPLGDDALAAELDLIVRAASALELFHAAALVHDDIMDNSDTRRGMSAAHRRFEEKHREAEWVGDPAEFGRSSAMLLGDLLLSWSEQLFDLGLQRLESPSAGAAARAEFNRMRTEVMVGQYLDILEEQAWRGHDERELLPRAHRVIVYKSAKYSIEAPLAIGAALGGATDEQVTSLRDFGLPLGIAYQLRDDLLGVFGDPDVTGKPSGDDLREGKRTVLIAIARAGLPTSARRFLDELLGDRELDDSQVRMLQAAIRDSGAVDQVERIIENNVTRARSALDGAEISPSAQRQLLSLVEIATKRSA